MFGFRKKEKEVESMTTYEEVKAAYEKLSEEDKGKFKRSLKDRIDESVGEREELEDDKDTQTAKDRIDEAIGEKVAQEKAEEAHEEAHEEAKHAGGEDVKGEISALREEIAALRAELVKAKQEPKKVDETEQDKLDKIARIYGE